LALLDQKGESSMDLFALGLGKAVCQASTAVVYAARCSDSSTLRSLGYSFFVAVALAIGLSARRLRTQR
jgi:hypothetical protein